MIESSVTGTFTSICSSIICYKSLGLCDLNFESVHGQNDVMICHSTSLIAILKAAVLANSSRRTLISLNMKPSWLTRIGT